MLRPNSSEDVPVWLTRGDEKRQSVHQMFSQIAPLYDFMNKVMSFGLDQRWRKAAVEKVMIQPNDKVADLCSGTGAFIPLILKKINFQNTLYAVDICQPMLQKAMDKYTSQVSFHIADICQLPFEDYHFDVITVGWGIRNVTDIDQAHQEIFRVLKPGGRFISVDMARPKNRLYRFFSDMIYPRFIPFFWSLVGLKKVGKYLPESTILFYDREQLKRSMEQSGFQKVQYKDFYCGNICMHWGIKI